MLVVIEGPDRCGKTTLFNALRSRLVATFVPATPIDPSLMEVMPSVEKQIVRLWESLYDPQKLYVCDRSPFISNVVYSQLYGRPVPDYVSWWKRLRVILLMPGSDYEFPGDPVQSAKSFEKVCELYMRHVDGLRSRVLLTSDSLEKQVREATEYSLKEWLCYS